MAKRLTAFQMKLIGICLMVFDHIHQMLYFKGIPVWFTMLGRLVAPIFLFLSAEGFHYTRNKLGYLRNLLVGFWFMGLMDMVLPSVFPNDHVMLINNIFGTLFLGVLFMYCYDGLKNMRQNKKQGWLSIGIIAFVLAYSGLFMYLLMNVEHISLNVFRFISLAFPNLFAIEGGFLFVLLALFFYIFREKRTLQIIILFVLSIITTGFNFTGLFSGNIQWMMSFSAILIWLYSGKEGKKMKWFFYYFYPLHIAALYLVSTFIS